MSSKLNLLESKMLLKEFNYLVSDIEFKNEFAMEYGTQFEIAVRQFLREKPLIKELCINKFGSKLNPDPKPSPSIESEKESEPINLSSGTDLIPFTGTPIEDDEDSLILEIDTDKIKKLYRDIVQKTHPDKVKSDALNGLYNRATTANKNQDLLSLYSICDELGIPFHVKQKEIDALNNRIKLIKSQQTFFESSHLWAWCKHEYDEPKRKDIIEHFLLNNAPAVKDLFN